MLKNRFEVKCFKALEMSLIYEWLNFLVAKFSLLRKMILYHLKWLVLLVMHKLWGGFILQCALQIWSNTLLMFLPQGRTRLEYASHLLLLSLPGCLGT